MVGAVRDLSYNEIWPGLYVGSMVRGPDEVIHLKSIGVTAVVNLQSDEDLDERAVQWDLLWRFYVSRKIKVVRYAIDDFSPSALSKKIEGAVNELDKLFKEGHTVYLHCTMGINRSPSVAIAWRMREEKVPMADAVEQFQRERACHPYPEVLEAWDRTLA